MGKRLVAPIVGVSMLLFTAAVARAIYDTTRNRRDAMRAMLSVVAAVAFLTMSWTGAALGQTKPACDAQGKAKTAEKVSGQVVRVEPAVNKIGVREADGTVHEFQAIRETLQDFKVGDQVEARLREAPKCP